MKVFKRYPTMLESVEAYWNSQDANHYKMLEALMYEKTKRELNKRVRIERNLNKARARH